MADGPPDPSYGYDLTALRAVRPPAAPPGFDAFWADLYARARAVRVAPTVRQGVGGDADVEVFDVSFTSLGGVRIGGWLTVPRAGPVSRGVVVGHGYGGRDAPEAALPIAGAAAIFPCARGMSRSRRPDLPDRSATHVLHGIGARETYIHGGCAADLWCAASALTELVPAAAGRLDLVGGSFGGGIGALALVPDDRFRSAYLEVPSFGHHPLRVTLPSVGSGESVRRYHHRHPEVLDVLAYFDAAVAASRIRQPVRIAPALRDPAVPPPGQFAVANALRDGRTLVLPAGHSEHPDLPAAMAEVRADLVDFFA